MKKEANGKKSLLWLWITIPVVVVLAIAGVVLALLLGGDKDPNAGKTPDKIESELYWNMDRLANIEAETGLSARKPGEDGQYHLRFAVAGEQVEYTIADKKLVNRIDMLDVVCLEFDEDGNIIDMIAPEELYTKMADNFFVQNVNGDVVTLNSSQALNGMQMPINIADAGVYLVDSKEEVIGREVEPEGMDRVIVYGDEDGNVDTVFINNRPWASEVYWRVEQFASGGKSTRVQQEDGYWYFDMAVNGEQKQFRTNIEEVINAIDNYGVLAACCGLVFDENGDVIDCFSAALAVRGSVQAAQFDVTEVTENSFTAEKLLQANDTGKTYTSVIDEDTKIFNVNSTAKKIGEVTELRVTDRVHVLADASGKAKVIYVINRMVDSPLYYNIGRNYSTGLGRTQRTPNAEGWYILEMAVGGKLKTFRTKDYDLVNKLDKISTSLCGLKLKGDIVVEVYEPVCVTGNYSYANGYFVTSINGSIMAAQSTSGNPANAIITPSCEVYDMTGNAAFKGVKTTLKVGDRIMCYKNTKDEVVYICVTSRYQKGTQLYWNVTRRISNGETTRTPDADGYYVIDVIKVGSTKVTQLKTKDKAVASMIDKQSSPQAFAGKVSGGIVTKAYTPESYIGGYITLNWTNLDMMNPDGTYKCVVYSTGASATLTPNANMKVYNFSDVTKTAKGEKTNLQVDDAIVCIANNKGQIEVVFVKTRKTDTKVYWNKTRMYNGTKAETTRLPDADGYYVFELAVDGQLKTFKTKDKDIATAVDANSTAFGLKVSGNIIQKVYPVTSSRQVNANGAGSWYNVESISGNTVKLKYNRPGQAATGNEAELKLASGYKVYNVAPSAGTRFGKADRLQKGDRIQAYNNKSGEACLIYIVNECTRVGGPYSKCSHCNKTVWWEQWGTGAYVQDDAHFYVGYNMEVNTLGSLSANGSNGETYDYVIDMNGYTITRIGTPNEPGGTRWASGPAISVMNGNTLLITDLSGKGGTLNIDPQGADYYASGSNAFAGILYCAEGSKLTIEKVKLDATNGSKRYVNASGGAIMAGGEVVINSGTYIGYGEFAGKGGLIGGWGSSSITINGGTFTAGKSTTGGVGGVIATTGKLTINGGTFIGDDQIWASGAKVDLTIKGVKLPGKVQVDAAKSVKISGAAQIGTADVTGLKLGTGVKADLTGLTNGAKVYIEGEGIVTTDFATAEAAQAMIDSGKVVSGYAGASLSVEGKALKLTVDPNYVGTWTNAAALPTEGNWKLGVDVDVTSTFVATGKLNLDLNGHDITRTVAEGTTQDFHVYDNGANIMTIKDTSSGTPGTIKVVPPAGQSLTNFGAVLYANKDGTLNIEGGIIDGSNLNSTYDSASMGTITVGGKLVVSGGTVKGVKNPSGKGTAIGGWSGTEIVVSGGTVIGNNAASGGTISTTGKLTVSGGEIKGGTASGAGDNIYTYSAAAVTISGGVIDGGVELTSSGNVTLSGAAKINEGTSYGLKSTVKVDVSGLTAGAKVYVDADGVFTKDLADAAAAQKLIDDGLLASGVSGKVLAVSGKAITVTEPGTVPDPGAPAAEWTDATKLPREGNYKLMVDVTTTAVTTLTGDLKLDLNGHDITRNVAAGTNSWFCIYSVTTYDLTIDDTSSNPGTIKAVPLDGQNLTDFSALIYVGDGVTVTINGGIIDASNLVSTYTSASMGAITVDGTGVLTVNGGTIKGLKNASGMGTAIGGWGKTTINITGGEIIGNQAENGGAVSTTGNLNITGGKISGGSATTMGANVYVYGSKTTTIGGDALIAGGVGVKDSVSLVLKDQPQFNAALNAGVSKDITIAGTAKIYLNDTTGTPVATTAGAYTPTYGTDGKVNGVTADAGIQEWSTAYALPTAAGYYKLTTDVEVAGVWTVASDIQVDLNGHNITRKVAAGAGSAERYAIMVSSGKSLTLVDYSGAATTGVIKTVFPNATDKTADYAGVLYLNSNVKAHLQNVTIDASNIPDTTRTGGSGTIMVGNDATLDIVNATVKGYKTNTAGSGTAIASWKGSEITISGDKAQIIGGNAPSGNGGVMAINSKLTVNGGTISVYEGSGATKNGGLISVTANAANKITINGGTFKGTTATNDGGILQAFTNELVINGGTFTGGKAGYGAQIHCTGKLTVNGGTFTGGVGQSSTVTACGGSILAAGADVKILGGSFYGNTAPGYGPNIYYSRTASGGGQLTIGGNARIDGGITVIGKSGATAVKWIITGQPVIDRAKTTGGAWFNLRMQYTDLYVVDEATPAAQVTSTSTNYSLSYNCDRITPNGIGVANNNATTYAAHNPATGTCTVCGKTN